MAVSHLVDLRPVLSSRLQSMHSGDRQSALRRWWWRPSTRRGEWDGSLLEEQGQRQLCREFANWLQVKMTCRAPSPHPRQPEVLLLIVDICIAFAVSVRRLGSSV